MKKFINRAQELGKKAAEIKQAIQGAPAKAAEIRQAVALTAGELHQLRSDVQSNLNGIRATSEDRVLQAMREVNDAALIFEEAGYELTGMDLDLALNQRLSVHLEKFDDIAPAVIRGLVANETRESVKAILSSIVKADETANKVELTYLVYHGLLVHVGPAPAIRISWRNESGAEETQVAPPVIAATVAATPPPVPTATIGSFFEQRSTPTPSVKVVPAEPISSSTSTSTSTSTPISAPTKSEDEPAVNPWSSSALDRFKKMPNLSKHR